MQALARAGMVMSCLGLQNLPLSPQLASAVLMLYTRTWLCSSFNNKITGYARRQQASESDMAQVLKIIKELKETLTNMLKSPMGKQFARTEGNAAERWNPKEEPKRSARGQKHHRRQGDALLWVCYPTQLRTGSLNTRMAWQKLPKLKSTDKAN